MSFREDWNVIPITKGKKYPPIKWEKYKTEKFPRDELKQFGEINYGIICGKISGGLVVIDLDFREGITPIEGFAKIWEKFSNILPQYTQTYAVRSPHGFHIYFITDFPLKTSHHKTGAINYEEILDGVDIQSDDAIIVIPPSEADGKPYIEFLPFDPIEVNRKQWSEIKNFFINEKMPAINYTRMRQPFVDILEGKIDIESYAKKIGKKEFLYWKYLFIEAYNRCEILPKQLYPFLKRNQPAFDVKKTETQLDSIGNDIRKHPLKSKTLSEFFPDYEIISPENLKDNRAAYIKIADELTDRFNLMTMDDSKELLVRRGNVCSKNTNNFYNDLADEVAKYNKTLTHLSTNILTRIKYKTLFSRNNFCFEEYLVNFKNGYYDVIERKFFSNLEYNDKLFCYEIPHNYSNEEADCPEFKKLLRDWLGEDNVITEDDIFEMMGYSMTMNTDMKTAFFIFGPSHSGKTQFQTVLEHIIGHQNRTSVSLQRLGKNEFGTNGMEFRILDMVGDMSKLGVKDVSVFKNLTGDDVYVSAEIKGGKQYQFRNIIKIWYNGNVIPIAEEDDQAFYNRWILINFPNIFPMYTETTIKRIGKKICQKENEVKGIIYEALRGVRRLYNRQYFRRELIINTRHEWKYQAEPLYAFIADHCSYDKNSWIEVDEFKEKFNDYLLTRRMKQVSPQKLNIGLENYGIWKTRKVIDEYERKFIYRGIKWNSDLERFYKPKFEEVV